MNKLVLFLLIMSLLSASGCTESEDSEPAPSEPGSPNSVPDSPQAGENNPAETEGQSVDAEPQAVDMETADGTVQIQTATVNITSENQEYQVYTAAPAAEGDYPAVVLIHSFNGFESGYQDMVDRMAANGYVIAAPFWQTYSRSPSDAEVEALIRNSIAYLEEREDVDSERLGLTGFCAGGRYTMLFLPQIKEFNSGVAWYGFPYGGDSEIQPEKPVDLVDQLDAPMLIIHGTRDEPSNITDIYSYAGELDAADKYFELKVYQGEPHGFMITEDGELSESFVAQDAYEEMISFFDRTLNNSTM